MVVLLKLTVFFHKKKEERKDRKIFFIQKIKNGFFPKNLKFYFDIAEIWIKKIKPLKVFVFLSIELFRVDAISI